MIFIIMYPTLPGNDRRSRPETQQEPGSSGIDELDQPEVDGSEMPAFVTKELPETAESPSETAEKMKAETEKAVGDD